MESANFNLFSFTPLNEAPPTSIPTTEDANAEFKKNQCEFCRRILKNKTSFAYHTVICKAQPTTSKGTSNPNQITSHENEEFEFFTSKNIKSKSEQQLIKEIEKKIGIKTNRFEFMDFKEEIPSDDEKQSIKPVARKNAPQKKKTVLKDVPSLAVGILQRNSAKKSQKPQMRNVHDLPDLMPRQNNITLRAKSMKSSQEKKCESFRVSPDDSHLLEEFNINDEICDFDFENDTDFTNNENFSLMVQNVETVDTDMNVFNNEVLDDIFASLDEGQLYDGDDLAKTSTKKTYEMLQKDFERQEKELAELKFSIFSKRNINKELETLQQDFDKRGKEMTDLKLMMQSTNNINKTVEKAKTNVEEENSKLTERITELGNENTNLKSRIVEKESIIVDFKKSNHKISKQLESNENKDCTIDLLREENESLKNTILLNKKSIETEQQKSSSLELEVNDLKSHMKKESKKVEELQKEKADLFKEIRKTSELQKKIRKLKAQQYSQQCKENNSTFKLVNNPITDQESTAEKQGIFLKTFSTLTATGENINSAEPKQADKTNSDLTDTFSLTQDVLDCSKSVQTSSYMESKSKEFETQLINFHRERRRRRKEIEGKLKIYKKQKQGIADKLEDLKEKGEMGKIEELKKELNSLLAKRNTSVIGFKMIEKQHEISLALYKNNYTSCVQTADMVNEDQTTPDSLTDTLTEPPSIEIQEIPMTVSVPDSSMVSVTTCTVSRDPKIRQGQEKPLGENEPLAVESFLDHEVQQEINGTRNVVHAQESVNLRADNRSRSPSLERIDISSSSSRSRSRTRSITRPSSISTSRSRSRSHKYVYKNKDRGSSYENMGTHLKHHRGFGSRSPSRSISRFGAESRSRRYKRRRRTHRRSDSRKGKSRKSSYHRNRSLSPHGRRGFRSKSGSYS